MLRPEQNSLFLKGPRRTPVRAHGVYRDWTRDDIPVIPVKARQKHSLESTTLKRFRTCGKADLQIPSIPSNVQCSIPDDTWLLQRLFVLRLPLDGAEVEPSSKTWYAYRTKSRRRIRIGSTPFTRYKNNIIPFALLQFAEQHKSHPMEKTY